MSSSIAPSASVSHDTKTRLSPIRSGVILGTLGVVFGDIGTSPLYALRECFSGTHSIALTEQNICGAVSLIVWFLIIIVSVKYVLFVLRAHNKGEGGILALMALVHRIGPEKIKNLAIIPLLGILGAALLFSDGVITPAISVLSAVEGLNVATPFFAPYVVPISIAVLVGLFAIQSRGTTKIGALFGPIILVWFVTIGILGIAAIIHCPVIVKSLNPQYAIGLLSHAGWKGFALLGTAFLAVTGAEVLYADMGHFGRKPIRTAWFLIVFPTLILNYMGQGAVLLCAGSTADNLFYQLAPRWFLYPLVIIATLATIIASQAAISGAFSLARQAVQLGFWPRIKITHTSTTSIGQVYVPFVNIALLVVTILLVLGFKESSNMASAYGIAVSATMLITTLLILLVAKKLWNVPFMAVLPFGILFLILDSSLFIANCAKLLSGGWIVALIAAGVCTLMTTWVAGRKILQKRVLSDSIPVEDFVKEIPTHDLVRIPKTAVFLSGNSITVPRALLHNYKHNGILHSQTLIVSVENVETPFAHENEQVTITDMGYGMHKIVLKYGFMESPNVPEAMKSFDIPHVSHDPTQLSYFLGKESLVPSHEKNMMFWRKQLFGILARNALSASSFFGLPPNRVVELGVQIEF